MELPSFVLELLSYLIVGVPIFFLPAVVVKKNIFAQSQNQY